MITHSSHTPFPITEIAVIIALDLFYSGEFEKTDLSKQAIAALNKADVGGQYPSSDVKKLLEPLVKTVIDSIVADIRAGYLSANHTALDFKGKIKPDSTYIADAQIEAWYTLHGLTPDEFYYDEYQTLQCQILSEIDSLIRGRALEFSNRLQHANPVKNVPEEITQEDYFELRQRLAATQNELDIQVRSEQQTRKIPRGNAEFFAKNREQVLGAALACLAAFPEKCKSDAGEILATAISAQIDEKSPLFWPDAEGVPLCPRKTDELINKWLKSTKQS